MLSSVCSTVSPVFASCSAWSLISIFFVLIHFLLCLIGYPCITKSNAMCCFQRIPTLWQVVLRCLYPAHFWLLWSILLGRFYKSDCHHHPPPVYYFALDPLSQTVCQNSLPHCRSHQSLNRYSLNGFQYLMCNRARAKSVFTLILRLLCRGDKTAF